MVVSFAFGHSDWSAEEKKQQNTGAFPNTQLHKYVSSLQKYVSSLEKYVSSLHKYSG
jgi:hypothetical protein